MRSSTWTSSCGRWVLLEASPTVIWWRERFEVTDGALLAWIAGRLPQLARAGDVVDVPPRRWHFLVAIGRSRARVLIRPGMRFDDLLAQAAAVARGDLRPHALTRLVGLLREHGLV